MAEVKYACPQCKASLKLKSEVPPGKKIKCPKCEAVFAPVPEAPKAAAKALVEDDGHGTFGFQADAAPPPRKISVPTDDEDEEEELKPRSEMEEVQRGLDKKFPKSKRGPAQAIVMKPSNQMLATASFVCASCIVSVIVALWPMVFSLKTELTSAETLLRWQMIGGCVAAFLYNGYITAGAVKMQSVEAYGWAMTSSFMMLLPSNWLLGSIAFFWFWLLVGSFGGDEMKYLTWAVLSLWFLYVGIWNVKTLRKPEVAAGFSAKREVF